MILAAATIVALVVLIVWIGWEEWGVVRYRRRFRPFTTCRIDGDRVIAEGYAAPDEVVIMERFVIAVNGRVVEMVVVDLRLSMDAGLEAWVRGDHGTVMWGAEDFRGYRARSMVAPSRA